MSLSLYWVAIPCVVAVGLLAYTWWRTLHRDPSTRLPKAKLGAAPPPMESRILSICPSSIGFYHVFFKVTGAYKYYILTAPEIVERCTYHQQPIPFCVGSDPLVSVDIPLNLGDALLIPPTLNINQV